MVFLETNRLRLRNVLEKDAEELFDYRNNVLCAKYQRGQTKDYNGIVSLIEKRKNDVLGVDAPAMLGVALRETDGLIGEIVVMPNEGTISFGYTFSYKIHRQGYAFEALSALQAHLEKLYPYWDYISFTETKNYASRALLKKLGYTDFGYLSSKESQVYGKLLRPDTLAGIRQAMRYK